MKTNELQTTSFLQVPNVQFVIPVYHQPFPISSKGRRFNSGLAKVGVSFFSDTLVVNRALVVQIDNNIAIFGLRHYPNK